MTVNNIRVSFFTST